MAGALSRAAALRVRLLPCQGGRKPMNESRPYEVYAVRYGHHARNASENFVGGDPHDGPMPLDYYVWVAVGPERTFLVDTGFTAEVAATRKREFLRCPIEALGLVGVRAGMIADVILTHLHYDHVGNFALLPAA